MAVDPWRGRGFRWVDKGRNGFRRVWRRTPGQRECAETSTARACSRVTHGHPSKNSSRVPPPSSVSINACTGTRVPMKRTAPLRISGSECKTCCSSIGMVIVASPCILRRSPSPHDQKMGRKPPKPLRLRRGRIRELDPHFLRSALVGKHPEKIHRQE